MIQNPYQTICNAYLFINYNNNYYYQFLSSLLHTIYILAHVYIHVLNCMKCNIFFIKGLCLSLRALFHILQGFIAKFNFFNALDSKLASILAKCLLQGVNVKQLRNPNFLTFNFLFQNIYSQNLNDLFLWLQYFKFFKFNYQRASREKKTSYFI